MDPVFLSILITGLAITYLVLGKYTENKSHDQEDFYLSGRKVRLLPLVFTILATQIGGASMIGAAQEAYLNGWYGFLYALGICGGLMLLALGVGARLRSLQLMTLPHLFEVVYQAPRLRAIAAVLSIASLFLILVGQGVAARMFFASAGMTSEWIFIAFWMVVVIYTTLGGLNAVIYTDLVQAGVVLMALTTVGAFCFVDYSDTLWALPTSGVLESNSTSISWVDWILMPMLFMIIGQDMGQRCCAAEHPKTVTTAMIIAAILFAVFTCIPVGLGLLARAEHFEILEGQSVLMSSIITLTNPHLAAFCGAALLMAIISTADSLLCAVSANLAVDVPWLAQYRFTHPRLKAYALSMPKMITLVLGVGAMLMAYVATSIIPMLVYAYELSIDVLFVPIFFGVMLNNPQKIFAVVSMSVGALGFVVTSFVHYSDWDKVVLLLLCAFSGWLAQYATTRWAIISKDSGASGKGSSGGGPTPPPAPSGPSKKRSFAFGKKAGGAAVAASAPSQTVLGNKEEVGQDKLLEDELSLAELEELTKPDRQDAGQGGPEEQHEDSVVDRSEFT